MQRLVPQYAFHFRYGELVLTKNKDSSVKLIPEWVGGVKFRYDHETALNTQYSNSLISLVHVNENMQCDILNYLDEVKEEFLPLHHLKIVKCTFSSREEALRRAVLIAVLTFKRDRKRGTTDFLKLNTYLQISQASSYVSEVMRL